MLSRGVPWIAGCFLVFIFGALLVFQDLAWVLVVYRLSSLHRTIHVVALEVTSQFGLTWHSTGVTNSV
ncbi:hypothetical protein DL95DRAFT_381744, partial [Leptodontidium sp. 2 PMI_412]